jgi:hypothetical protein
MYRKECSLTLELYWTSIMHYHQLSKLQQHGTLGSAKKLCSASTYVLHTAHGDLREYFSPLTGI